VQSQSVIPLYKRSQWPRWQKLCGDMSSSFNEWLKQHQELLKDFTARGIQVSVVEVDIDAYILWLSAEKLPVSNETRTQFAIQTFTQKYDDQSNN
jgi:hypothetical protein